MRNQIIFIASTGHSGSTLLELILCAHPDCIGVGEVFQIVDPHNDIIHKLKDQYCACGKTLPDCEYWEKTTKGILSNLDWTATQKYQYVFKKFSEIFGEDKTAVDSSKVPGALSLVMDIENINTKVIHLVRDVRPWTVSMQEVYKRNNDNTLLSNIKKRGLKGFVKYLQRSRFYDYHYWYWTNKKIDSLIRKGNVPVFRLSYEQLCLNPKSTIKKLCVFLELNFNDKMLGAESTQSHNAFGNRMRFQPEKRKQILYDNRWFYNECWVLPSLLFPYIMRFNKKLLYSRSKKSVWNK